MIELTLELGGYAPRDSSHGTGLETMARIIGEGSNGMVKVSTIWNILDQRRPATDLFDLVEGGELFLCYFSTSYQGSRVPALNIIELPYLFPDLDAAHVALDGSLGERLAREVRDATPFQVLGFWDNGFRHLSNRLRPVHEPADCAGMTVRLQPNRYHEAMIQGWGAIPVPVELSAGIALIVAGEVDAQENPLANTVAYGVDHVHRFITMTSHLYGARALFANRRRWEALPEDLRDLVGRAAREAVAAQRAAAIAGEESLRRRLEATGTAFVDPTPQQRRAFTAASQPAWDLARAELPNWVFEEVGA